MVPGVRALCDGWLPPIGPLATRPSKHRELAAGIRTPASYTVEQYLKDCLQTLNTQAEGTVTGYQIMVSHPTRLTGTIKLVELILRDVDFALGKLAKRLSTRSVRLARMILIPAIRNAMVNDVVVQNVADLAAAAETVETESGPV